jgi:hypothetical protein
MNLNISEVADAYTFHSISTLRSTLVGQPNAKKQKTENLVPILHGLLLDKVESSARRSVKILLDSGASTSIAKASIASHLETTQTHRTQWRTVAGTFVTDKKAHGHLIFPELSTTKTVECDLHLSPSMTQYDVILGRDMLQSLGINLNFSNLTIEWEEAVASMKPSEMALQELTESTTDNDYVIPDKMQRILDAKYEKADLEAIAEASSHLNRTERRQLLRLLQKHEAIFQGKLGLWKRTKCKIQLKPDATPYHARPFPVPKSQEDKLKRELERLCSIGVLRKVNRSVWAAPAFAIPKKDETIRFISDFRELNKRVIRTPFPIPIIHDVMLKMEGFQYATSLDLNMGYYHIELTPNSKALCTIVLPWGKYEYQRLPMGLVNSSDIFQEEMSGLMADLEYVRTYIDDLLVLTRGSFEDHLQKLDVVLQRLKKAGLQVNAKKSFFARHELEYLGFWITRNGVKPVAKKIDALLNVATPTTQKQLRSFIGMVNYYKDMWIRRSEILAPLTKLTSINEKWQWTPLHQQAFDNIKAIMGQEVLLTFPNFQKCFDIHTDASKLQLGSVISQEGKPIAFYSRKLNDAQTRYTTTERELLAIVETLKEFRNILLGQQIRVYTDHKNLTYKDFNTDRVMRWRLIIEEFGPEILYVKGINNPVADALSRLNIQVSEPEVPEPISMALVYETLDALEAIGITISPVSINNINTLEAFGLQLDVDLPDDAFPVTYQYIRKCQREDAVLTTQLKTDKTLSFKTFRAAGVEYPLICTHERIVIPAILQRRIVTWYHEQLCHPGETRTENTLKQHYYWQNMRRDIHDICSKCPTCQKNKRLPAKFGHLPPKDDPSEYTPWEKVCVDLIGPYEMETMKTGLKLWCVTMIDPATGWVEIREIPTKRADVVANIVDAAWFTRYPLPAVITYDKGREFMKEFAQMVTVNYGIKRRGTTTRNPQANAILERMHKTLANMIRTFPKECYDADDPWTGILAAAMFALRATVHGTLRASPSQLVFGRDAILNTKFTPDWNAITKRKQQLILKNNQRENAKRKKHNYKIGDLVLYQDARRHKLGKDAYNGPYAILSVNQNGTVRLQLEKGTDVVNIRQIKPFIH